MTETVISKNKHIGNFVGYQIRIFKTRSTKSIKVSEPNGRLYDKKNRFDMFLKAYAFIRCFPV